MPIIDLIRNNQATDEMRKTAGFAVDQSGGLMNFYGDQLLSA